MGDVKIFYGAKSLAKHLQEILKEKNLLNNENGKIEFIDSKNSEKNKDRFFEILENVHFSWVENFKLGLGGNKKTKN